MVIYMKKRTKHKIKNMLLLILGLGAIFLGIIIIWVSTLKLPDFKSFTDNKIASSTKIYDRTGTILLYDVHQNIKRTTISGDEMGINIKNATVAIEDSEFYQHSGIRVKSIIRATFATLSGKRVEGGSTITQQLIKNTLLTSRRTITRKIKEWILAVKLEQIMSKDDILALYLNEAPYGGEIYGIEEASKLYFGKEPKDLTLAESAYLAAIPNSPTYLSPYRSHKDKLDERKNLVLKRMHDLKFISDKEYNEAKNEQVAFLPEQPVHIAAPHFVFFIKDYLEKKYGVDSLDTGGMKVITTLDYDLQKKAEDIAKTHALENEKVSNGKNAAVVAIDPNTGQILAMVGSRDYFDKSVDGNFNVATAARQPGSSFKPFVYATAFNKGYTEQTVLFDTKTEFSSLCSPTGIPNPGHTKKDCYSPDNYDNNNRGPMTLKDALAQSINVVAVKLLYLAGVPDSIKTAHDLGITTLNDPSRYGLSLVIGGGEVTLLDMTSAYGAFATGGIRHPYTGILFVTDDSGIREEFKDESYRVLPENTTKMISDILKDNTARIPTFGANSSLLINGVDAAVKTGTTNDNKDAWTVGYTTSVVVGAWVGNNDNQPMKKGGAALAGPIWNEVLQEAIKTHPWQPFEAPDPVNQNIPSIMRGDFRMGGDAHTILYYIDKSNPLTLKSTFGGGDSLFNNFEYGVQKWWARNKGLYPETAPAVNPTVNANSAITPITNPILQINGIDNASPLLKNNSYTVNITINNVIQIQKIDIFINGIFITSLKNGRTSFTFTPSEIKNISNNNIMRAVGYDISGGSGETTVYFSVE